MEKTNVVKIAKAAHEMNRAWCRVLADLDSSPRRCRCWMFGECATDYGGVEDPEFRMKKTQERK